MPTSLRSTWISGAMLLIALNAQAQQEAQKILTAALEYPGLQSFWCRDSSGRIALDYIDSGQQMTANLGLKVFDQSVPMGNQTAPDGSHAVVLRRLKLNSDRTRAKLRLVYHRRVKARFILRYNGGHWWVKRALIRQQEGCGPENSDSRFVWDF